MERTDWSRLMARGQDGDKEAYGRLLREMTPFLRALARRCHADHADVEDAVQDILLTVHTIRHTYDPARPFGPWIVTIARRRLIDRVRARARRAARETRLEPVHEALPGDDAADPEIGAELPQLHRALAGLPPSQRRVIELLKLGEMSLKEAAAATGMSTGALKVATHRALKALRVALVESRS
jgi:RNA polymerase sigma-70 factor (ECF subfamily)